MREDAIVAAIARLVAGAPSPRVLLGIGDDAALWQPSRSHRSAITTDVAIEGVHFTRESMSLEDAGWRAMTANASDLAAMGARPVLATVALTAGPQDGEAEILALYRGLAAAAAAYGLAIAGGDLSRGERLAAAIAAVGEVRPSNVKTRAGGRPGDVLAVTGPLGGSRAGLFAAREGAGQAAPEALEAFRRPVARCAEGRFLGASRNVGAMMDVSDGLSTDLPRLCAASGCGASVERVPVAAAARSYAASHGIDADAFALAGGEEYELLVAVRPRAFANLATRFAARFGRPLERVGVLDANPGVRFGGAALAASGWDHFAR